MDETFEHDMQVARLRRALENVVNETGSLTHERVLRVSTQLDEAILRFLREEKKRKAQAKKGMSDKKSGH